MFRFCSGCAVTGGGTFALSTLAAKLMMTGVKLMHEKRHGHWPHESDDSQPPLSMTSGRLIRSSACMRIGITLLITSITLTAAAQTNDCSKLSTEQLVDSLVQIDAATGGIVPTVSLSSFIVEDNLLCLFDDFVGSPAPKIFPPMRELVKRGITALPVLIKHLTDDRATKLTIDKRFIFQYMSDEYDPKDRAGRGKHMEKWFTGAYTVKVGDVCYALIAQIVNRKLYSVRGQPTCGLVINSPIETPSLVEAVKKDWGAADQKMHRESLVHDVRYRTDGNWFFEPTLTRLRYYYPEEYNRLKSGDLKEKVAKFEKAQIEKAQKWKNK